MTLINTDLDMCTTINSSCLPVGVLSFCVTPQNEENTLHRKGDLCPCPYIFCNTKHQDNTSLNCITHLTQSEISSVIYWIFKRFTCFYISRLCPHSVLLLYTGKYRYFMLNVMDVQVAMLCCWLIHQICVQFECFAIHSNLLKSSAIIESAHRFFSSLLDNWHVFVETMVCNIIWIHTDTHGNKHLGQLLSGHTHKHSHKLIMRSKKKSGSTWIGRVVPCKIC